jgi:tRNA threonylcarbamoyl adenosine modification protein YeaZ
MTYVLSIESSTPTASLALYQDKTLIGFAQSTDQRSHSEFVLLAVEDLLAKSNISIKDLKTILVANGPGSFTGLRVATCLAKTLAYASNVDVWTTDTLKVMRRQADINKPCFISLNAHKNLFFIAKYNSTEFAVEPRVVSQEVAANEILAMQKSHAECVLLGDGPGPMLNSIRPNAKSLADLYFDNPKNGMVTNWIELIPRYLRESDAELFQKK